MTKLKRIKLLTAIYLIGGIFASAQVTQPQTVTDEELKLFASAFQQIQIINQTSQQEMINEVEKTGITVDRYNEISQSKQTGVEIELGNEELEKFNASSQAIQQIQALSQEQMQQKIIETGLSLTRYQEILEMIQSDTKLQEKVQKYLQG